MKRKLSLIIALTIITITLTLALTRPQITSSGVLFNFIDNTGYYIEF